MRENEKNGEAKERDKDRRVRGREGGGSNVSGASNRYRSSVKARLSRGIEPADAFRGPFIRCETRLLSLPCVCQELVARGSQTVDVCMRTYSIASAAALDRIDMFGARLLRLRIRRTSTRQYTLLETESPGANAIGHCANFPSSPEYRSAAPTPILASLIEFARTALGFERGDDIWGRHGTWCRDGASVQPVSAVSVASASIKSLESAWDPFFEERENRAAS